MMATFKSDYKKLGFYVKGKLKEFALGVYHTEDKDEIKALEKLSGVFEVKEKEAVAEKPTQTKQKAADDDLAKLVEDIEVIEATKNKTAEKEKPKTSKK
jgi:hypothetical protein